MSDLKIAPVVSTSSADSVGEPIAPLGQLLVLVLDINPNQPLFIRNPRSLLNCLDAAFTLANSHLMLHSNNTLAAIAAHSQSCTYLYPMVEEGLKMPQEQVDAQFEGFSKIESALRQKVKEILYKETDPRAPVNADSLLSGALCMALAYINRQRTYRRTHSAIEEKGSARILVLSASGDTASQYMNYMNVFFSAQKMNIGIDTLMLDKDSGLLQQGADITGGVYHKISSKHERCLLQVLLWMYLPDRSLRSYLSLPSAERVDYRAACFCHRQLVEIGFVCSVCLSIYCKFSPICTTCHTVFKAPGPLPMLKKKANSQNPSPSK